MAERDYVNVSGRKPGRPPIPAGHLIIVIMAKLKIVIGANGAGKSTWCSEHRNELPSHFYDADSIARGLGDWNNPERQKDARELVDKAIRNHLENNDDFGFESTYSGQSRPNIIRRAAAQGYTVEAIFIGTTNPEITPPWRSASCGRSPRRCRGAVTTRRRSVPRGR